MILAFNPTREEVDRIMFDEDIYDRITSDNTPDDISEVYESDFVAGSVDGQLAALLSAKDNQLHFMVLKRFRKHARELWKECYRKYGKKGFLSIPSLYPEVINFAKNMGFREFGIDKQSFLKNGKLYDNHILIEKEI